MNCRCGCGETLHANATYGCKLGHRPQCSCGCGERIDRRSRSGIKLGHAHPPGFAVNAETGCHEWTGRRHSGGYGLIGGKNLYAHREAWQKEHGPIAPGLVVRHHCDNPCCVNVAHLEAGTHAQNMDDMARRHRNHARRSLTPEQVRAVRRDPRPATAIAREYGVSQGTILNLRNGVTYRRVA